MTPARFFDPTVNAFAPSTDFLVLRNPVAGYHLALSPRSGKWFALSVRTFESELIETLEVREVLEDAITRYELREEIRARIEMMHIESEAPSLKEQKPTHDAEILEAVTRDLCMSGYGLPEIEHAYATRHRLEELREPKRYDITGVTDASSIVEAKWGNDADEA